MPRLLFSSTLLAAALIGPARSSDPAEPSRLRVVSYPDGQESRLFRLSTTGAGVRIAGSVTLAAGRDTILATPVGIDLEPGAQATLEASGTGGVSLVILPDSGEHVLAVLFEVLKAFRPHIFFDDQEAHLGPASKVVPSGKVPYASDSLLLIPVPPQNPESTPPR